MPICSLITHFKSHNPALQVVYNQVVLLYREGRFGLYRHNNLSYIDCMLYTKMQSLCEALGCKDEKLVSVFNDSVNYCI